MGKNKERIWKFNALDHVRSEREKKPFVPAKNMQERIEAEQPVVEVEIEEHPTDSKYLFNKSGPSWE